MAMEAELYRQNPDNFVDWSPDPKGSIKDYHKTFDRIITEPENLPFLTLPIPDRAFTRAKEYDSGNYKYLPGTHILSASGCWWGKCSFCVEKGQPYLVRSVEDVISEIEECRKLGFKEVFDDSATFPTGQWLNKFISRISSFNIHFSCNCRIGYEYPFMDMRNAGFRMLLFGIESANQYTLDRINKGIRVEDIIPTLKKANDAGLENHIAAMIGYSWESLEDTIRTINLVKYLLIKGYAKTAQMSFYTPPEKDGNETYRKYVNKFYEVGFNPEFWYNKIISIRSMADIRYLLRGIKSYYAKDKRSDN